ncbi:formyltetrahydrofolate deformylase [Sandaracinobacteroides hominis]|uniref:formyltetrahydrofolate deformylase n=1 Tax=Sandaracinobacteroides hominis TaxID=2780086 RepID=UPI0018F63A23|nr:formyltetrahydrofolate deformylase [Sandaracinobacteroides hominis]
MADAHFIMTVVCEDAVGIVAAVASHLAANDAFIVESQQYADLASGRFFMRVGFKAAGPRFPGGDALRAGFAPVAQRFGMDWHIHDTDRKLRVLLAVSKASHCLNDLLHRWQTGTLPVEIPAIVSNHETMRPLAEWHGIPFLHLPVGPENRVAQEAALLEAVVTHRIDLTVLARYMQVLSPALCAQLAWRCINIHHSFLPSFKGARPYHQAHERGVKLIGATAHFVTSDLDEGPIIEQDSLRVDHALTPDELATAGRDVEAQVLARALLWAAEHRILANGRRTVVFRR